MTNFQKIKSMSEREMTNFLYAVSGCRVCDYRNRCRRSPYRAYSFEEEKHDCSDGIEKWLREQTDI